MPPSTGPRLLAPCAKDDGSLPAECPGWCEFADPPRVRVAKRDFAVGDELAGGYTLLCELGRGGMGTVYIAADAGAQPVAVKALHHALANDLESHGRFLSEAKAMQRVHHRNVVRIYDVGETAGVPFFVMELVDGYDLRDLIDEGDAIGERARRLEILRQLCDALTAIHATGTAHLDVKPSNVLIADGRGLEVRLCDFGLSRPVAPCCRFPAGEMSGTPGFVAPEVIAGAAVRPEPSADVYGLGAIAFELMTGRSPFESHDTQAMLAAHRPPPRAAWELGHAAPPQLAAQILAALRENPAQRPSIAQLRAAFDAAGT